ncbi:hypothetical protein FALCPG4_015860 [Fusarium falciforme]
MSSKNLSLQPRACEVCHQREDLLRCSGCQAVYYCGRDHQASDRPRHKKACSATKKFRAHFEQEEQKLRDHPGDWLTPANLFENAVGRFWGIHETRPYMRARYKSVDILLQLFGDAGGRVDVVQTALDHLLDMIRLCRGDNMGLRDIVPALYIRLGRDQEAYDFMKWYATTGNESDYDWGDMDLPFLDVKDADVFESPKKFWVDKGWLDLSHSAAVALIKVRVLLDLQAIQNATSALRGTVPQEIIDTIRGQLVGSVVASRPGILMGGTDEIARLVETIKGQVGYMYKAMNKYNPHFWRLMLSNGAAAADSRPDSAYSPKTEEEACLVISYNYASWAETPGAIAAIRTLSKVI